jgi:hypothetical protein
MTDLLSKLRSAEAGSRELDAEIALVLGWQYRTPVWVSPTGATFFSLPRTTEWTTSIDAIVALIEEKLPGRGHGYLPGFFGPGTWAGIIADTTGVVDLKTAVIERGGTPAIAICLALLTALGGHNGR